MSINSRNSTLPINNTFTNRGSIFPINPLADFRAQHRSKVKHVLSAASPDSLNLSELLGYATQQEHEAWQSLKLDYAPASGSDELREQIAQGYPGLNAEHILTFAGAQEAIFAVYHALLSPGDVMQGISPHFGPLHLVAQGIGAKVNIQTLDFDTQQNKNSWSLDVDQWCQRLKTSMHESPKATKLSVINFPHNPTGAMLCEQELKQMVNTCAEHDCWLFSDEVFRGLEYEKNDQLPPVASLYDKGVSLGVMSKSHGLGGVRVGWVACKNTALLKRLVEIKEYLSICNSITDEYLAIITLKNGDAILKNNRQQAKDNLALLEKNRHLLPHLKWSAPKAGVLLYPQLVDETLADTFVLDMLNTTGALVLPGHCFGHGQNHFRVGYGRKTFHWQALQSTAK